MNSEMLYKHCFLSKVCLERSYDMKRSYCFPLGNILCKNDIFSNIQKLSPGGVLNNSAKFAEKYVCVGVSFLKTKKKKKEENPTLLFHCCSCKYCETCKKTIFISTNLFRKLQ